MRAVLQELDYRTDKGNGLFPCSRQRSGGTLTENERFSTIYFGGGTPSSLGTPQLDSLVNGIRERIDMSCVEEWTMECNPDDITPELAEWIGRSPINRISMGAQTFSDERLRWLCRRHTSRQVEEAVSLLRKNGIDNISIDLMFGFPSETLEEWEEDIDAAVALRPEHISAYSLMYEEDTPLFRMLEQGKVTEVDEELSRKMYETLVRRLKESGYIHYEISNFCLPSRQSRHNSSYWNQVSYLGLGAAAHSYNGRRRWWNVSDVKGYLRLIHDEVPAENGIGGECEDIDSTTRYNDIITTALRTSSGISLNSLTDGQREYLLLQSERHLKNGTLAMDDGRLHLTESGIFISDDIMSDLIFIEE